MRLSFLAPQRPFLLAWLNHPAVYVPRLPAGFNLPAPVADELLKLASARQQVQAHILKLRRQLSMLDGPPQPSKLAYGHNMGCPKICEKFVVPWQEKRSPSCCNMSTIWQILKS
ncbi:hypothetical protein NC653_018198 [Populus alba x Populus x berolinensis]|uniref:Uncharacterized protein n=1 Tax=Populus alba x Populus x berolinensis TaxID=444605 RepID=A0AAD6VUK3_9ROSI|nr:hypothetical protein NC653_018198 [Populus alba x Populus x berolinensis]